MSDTKRIPVAAPVIGEREIAYVTQAVRSGWVSSIGEFVDRFEADFARFVGVEHAIAVSNGTVALHVALHALGIGPGHEVIVPDLTFAATAHAVLQTGATPVLVDVAPDTWCMSPRALERAISRRTRAIIPVHLYGHPADMTSIRRVADRCSVPIIEDAAEAHGAEWEGLKVGSLGRVGAFSFYGNKIITTGEGGMLTTGDPELARRIRFLKDHGMTAGRRYHHTELAFNYRMTNVQAALGVAQLEQIDGFIEAKRRIFRWYREELGDIAGLSVNPQDIGGRSVYWMSAVVLPDDCKKDVGQIALSLSERGIDTRPFFEPLSRMPHLSNFPRVGVDSDTCPVASSLWLRGLCLPSGCTLTRSDIAGVAEELRAAIV